MNKLLVKAAAAAAACALATPSLASGMLLVDSMSQYQFVQTDSAFQVILDEYSEFVIPDFGCVDSMCVPPDWIVDYGIVKNGPPPIEWYFNFVAKS